MKDFQESTYGDRIAEVYDDLHGGLASPEVVDPMVDVLADLAGCGKALELGIGTGRIALPLAARGVEVHGIDASAAIVEKLRRKPGGDRIPVALGDFADVEVDGRFSLVYVVFNTFFALLSQEAQVRCFVNVARRLSDGGVFLIEAFAPDLTRFERGQNIQAGIVETDRVSIHLSRHDAVAQTVATSHMYITEGGVPAVPGQAALRVALRTGPDGEAGGDAAAEPVGRLEGQSVHRIERQPRLGLRAAEALRALQTQYGKQRGRNLEV